MENIPVQYLSFSILVVNILQIIVTISVAVIAHRLNKKIRDEKK